MLFFIQFLTIKYFFTFFKDSQERKPLLLKISSKKDGYQACFSAEDNQKIIESIQDSATVENENQLIENDQGELDNNQEVMVVKDQCLHSDGYIIRDKMTHFKTTVGEIAVTNTSVKDDTTKLQKSKKNGGVRGKPKRKLLTHSHVGILKADNDLATRNRYALDFPKHNWLVEQLKSENKLEDREIEKLEQKLQQNVRDEKEEERQKRIKKKEINNREAVEHYDPEVRDIWNQEQKHNLPAKSITQQLKTRPKSDSELVCGNSNSNTQ